MNTYHRNTIRIGQVDMATMAIELGFRASLLGGENLSLLQQYYGDQLKLAVSGYIVLLLSSVITIFDNFPHLASCSRYL